MAIVFVHTGYSPYLEFTLRQARAASPESEIVLLGNATNDRFPFVRHIDIQSGPYVEAVEDIRASYVHMSTNREAFELACFERWFILRQWMQETGASDALVFDTDVMLYASETEIRSRFSHEESLALCLPPDPGGYVWSASAHASYWGVEAVNAFCAFVMQSYTEEAIRTSLEDKWTWHREEGVAGGVCDMTALYLFAQTHPEVHNLLRSESGVAFDHNINVAANAELNEVEMEGHIKQVHWDNARPYSLRQDGDRVRWLGLHLQGQAKAHIPKFYTGPDFEGARSASRSVRGHYAARNLAASALRWARRFRR